eukprot:5799040-Prymnesium_polylepis.1
MKANEMKENIKNIGALSSPSHISPRRARAFVNARFDRRAATSHSLPARPTQRPRPSSAGSSA